MPLNWKYGLESNNTSTTLVDKIKELLSIKDKLVLVQCHELERLSLKREKLYEHTGYIDYLYNHYIILKQPKTYLCQ